MSGASSTPERDLALRREHVTAAMVNWLPKSQNLRTLASRLNLGIDSFIFIDDNPVECAEVRAGCPEVLTLQWPQQPERAIVLLRQAWELEATAATKEDQRRTQMYRDELQRQSLRTATLTFNEFLESLELVVDVAPLIGREPASCRAADTADQPVQLHDEAAG